MDWQNVLGVAATIFALASAAGLGLMRGTLGNLRAHNDDLRKRVSDLEAAQERDKVEKLDLQNQITRLQDHEQYLQSVVRDRANYEIISTQVEDIHKIVVRIEKHVKGPR